MQEEHVIDLIPGYVLECLDDEDLCTVARHLAHCAMCSKELAAYQDTLNQMAMAEPGYTPPPDLKQKVLSGIEQKVRQRAKPSRTVMTQPGFWAALRSAFASPAVWVLGGVTLLVIIILGLINVQLGQRVNDLQARLPVDNVTFVRLTGAQDAPQTVGYIMVFKNEFYGSLVVEDAPVLDSQHQYQLWLIKDGKRTNGGLFTVNGSGYGVLDVASDQPLENFQSFGITVEPSGGSSGPTGKKILGGSF